VTAFRTIVWGPLVLFMINNKLKTAVYDGGVHRSRSGRAGHNWDCVG